MSIRLVLARKSPAQVPGLAMYPDYDYSAPRRKCRREDEPEEEPGRLGRFVSAGDLMHSMRPEIEQLGDVHVDLPTQFGQRIAEGASARRERAAVAKDVPTGSLVSKYPTVAKMMVAMGYEDGVGLGRSAQGIVAPVASTSRNQHEKTGLGFGQEPEHFSGTKENVSPPAPAPAKEEHPRWSKKAGKRKGRVLTKSALLATRAEHEQLTLVVQKVIDMRGPQARMLTDLTGLNNEQETEEADDGVPVPELQHNVRLLIVETEADIVCLDARLRREQGTASSLRPEKQRLAAQEAVQHHLLHAMETIAGALEQVRADDAAGVLTPRALLETFRDLKARHEEVFETCGVAWIACELARPLLAMAFQGWQPLRDPSFGVDVMSPWKDLLHQKQAQSYSTISQHGTDPYAMLVREVILPVIIGSSSATSSWDARDPEPMLRLLENWDHLLLRDELGSILDHVIMPKLSAAIDSRDPRRRHEHDMPIHVWVHPWLPILGRRRMETLCHYIVPKLRLTIQEFEIDPAARHQENLNQFNDQVMIWACVIPVHNMVQMLEAHFFGRWHQVLYHRLCSSSSSPDPDLGEILRWYEGWKALFPPDLVADKRIQVLLAAGLVMMNQAAEGVEVVCPGRLTDQNRQRRRCHDAAAAEGQQRASRPNSMVDRLSFREAIQAYAMDHGVLFMRRPGRSYNGVPVYGFGAVSVCIDSVKRVIYAQLQEGGGRWSAVSLTQLMKMNRTEKVR